MIQVTTSPEETTVWLTGDLDLSEREQFSPAAARVAAARAAVLVIDMCAMEFMDSTGAAFVITLADAHRRRGGELTRLRGASERDLFVLEVCGALDLFGVDPLHRCRDNGDREQSA